MGGNRVSNPRMYLNLWLVFLASGLWHGAAWGFIIWGAYHGALLVIERIFLSKWLAKLGKAAFIYTFIVVAIGWVFFRTEHLSTATGYLSRMFTWHTDASTWKPDNEYFTTLGIALLFSFFTLSGWGERIQQKVFYSEYSMKLHYVMAFVAIALCLISAGRITVSTFNPFIYFRF